MLKCFWNVNSFLILSVSESELIISWICLNISWFSGKPFHTPVTVKGFAENRAEIVSLNMDCSFTMRLDCDRCLNAFEREFHYCFSHTLVRELSAENDDMDDYIVVDGDQLDLDELVFV